MSKTRHFHTMIISAIKKFLKNSNAQIVEHDMNFQTSYLPSSNSTQRLQKWTAQHKAYAGLRKPFPLDAGYNSRRIWRVDCALIKNSWKLKNSNWELIST